MRWYKRQLAERRRCGIWKLSVVGNDFGYHMKHNVRVATFWLYNKICDMRLVKHSIELPNDR